MHIYIYTQFSEHLLTGTDILVPGNGIYYCDKNWKHKGPIRCNRQSKKDLEKNISVSLRTLKKFSAVF